MIDMGTLTSPTPEPTGHTYRGVLLGEPAETDGGFAWDDSAFPNGTVEVRDGALIVTPEEATP